MTNTNYISHNNFYPNQMMKPLGGIGGDLGLDFPQKISTSTAATSGSIAEGNQDGGKPAFLFGTHHGFGGIMSGNTN